MPLLLEKPFLGGQFMCFYFGLENQICLQGAQEARYGANTRGMGKGTEEGGQMTSSQPC